MVQAGFFSNFVFLQLTLWHLDPLTAIAFVPLLNWIQTRRTLVNIRGTGNDCFKWAVLAGMYPVDIHEDRSCKYVEQVDFSSLPFHTPFV